MSGLTEWAGWVSAVVLGLGAFAGGVASHARLSSRQRSDRELLEAALKAETQAREAADELLATKIGAAAAASDAADKLLEEKLKGWTERLRLMEAEQDRTRDLAEKVARLAAATESLAERVADAQDRTDERFRDLGDRLAADRARTA